MKLALIPFAAVIALGLAWAPPAALAQQAPGQGEMPPPAAAKYDSDDLKSYASAVVELRKINEEYTKRLQSAGSPEEQQSVREEATGKMVEAIEEEGLTVEKYNDIYNAALTDPQIAQEVNEYLREAQ